MSTLYPLTAFEEYMLIDETIDHPMTFFLRADLVGRVHVAELGMAFSEVVRRHPIFWSTVVRRFCPRLSWKMVPDRMPTLTVRPTTSFGQCQLGSYIDLDREPGIRGQLNYADNKAELWLQFHHSCGDGIAGIRFLEELLAAYRIRVSGGTPLGSCEPGRFPTHRCAFQNLSWSSRVTRLTLDCGRIWAFLHRLIIDFEDRSHDGHSRQRTATPSFVESRLPFSKAMMERLKRTQPLAPTVNDLVLRDVYLALGDWMRRQQPRNKERWIRISAATNMRKPIADENRCHNDVSLVFLDRRLHHLKNPAELLRGISAEMTQIKQDHMGRALLRGLSWFRALPGGIAMARKLHRAYATAVVSNLGSVLGQQRCDGLTTAADLRISQLGFLVPIREGTPVSFGVLTHANELTVSMQYDDGVFDTRSARQLLSHVIRRLSDSLGIRHEERDGMRQVA